MDRFSFTLQVDGVDLKSSQYEDRLYEAGCDDALVAVIENTLFVDFDREGPSFEAAVASARDGVERAGGRVVQVTAL